MLLMKMDETNERTLSLSGTDTFYTDALNLSQCSAGSIQFVWTGSTPVATSTVWATNDPRAVDNTDDTGWTDVTSTIASVNITGNSGSGFVDIPPAENLYSYYRMKIVNASGTATVSVFGVGKLAR